MIDRLIDTVDRGYGVQLQQYYQLSILFLDCPNSKSERDVAVFYD